MSSIVCTEPGTIWKSVLEVMAGSRHSTMGTGDRFHDLAGFEDSENLVTIRGWATGRPWQGETKLT